MTDTRTFDELFARTLDDGRMSRAESKVLKEMAAGLKPQQVAQVRSRAFQAAEQHLTPQNGRDTLQWIEEMVKALHSDGSRQGHVSAEEVWFFPEEDERGLERLLQIIGGARRTLNICVFTITNNRISDAIAGAHRRGVKVRIISDDDKSQDRGSDIEDLARSGVPVRIDKTRHHMHHKFAVADSKLLLNGSFNWTRSAATSNHENIQITNSPELIGRFEKEFERLWASFS